MAAISLFSPCNALIDRCPEKYRDIAQWGAAGAYGVVGDDAGADADVHADADDGVEADAGGSGSGSSSSSSDSGSDSDSACAKVEAKAVANANANANATAKAKAKAKETWRYLALVDATTLLLSGASMTAVLAASPVSHRQFTRLFENAVAFVPDGSSIVGFAAFVKHTRTSRPAELVPAVASLIDCCPYVYRNLMAWPLFDASVIKSDEAMARYKALVKTTQLFLANQPMSEVRDACPVSWRQYSVLFRRAMELRPDKTHIRGYEAFAGWKAGNPRKRRKPHEHFEGARGNASKAGYGGLFSALMLAHPDIEKGLIEFLNKHQRPNKVTRHVLHVEFKRILNEMVNLSPNVYPLNTASEARRPLDYWFKNSYLPRYQLKFLGREQGKSAAQVIAYAQGDGQSKLPPAPFTTFSLDEITVDMMARYEIPSILGDWDQLDLRRFAVIRLRELSMGLTMCTRLILTPQASGEDISILLYEALSGPSKAPMVVTDLDYMEGAGYPTNIYETLRWVAMRTVFLDNALSHLKDAVQNMLTHLGGGEVHLGSPATPQERAATESEIGLLASRLLHQLPGTTGSDPKDPVRKGAAVKVEQRVDVEALNHVIDVYSANSNVLPTAASGHIGGLERLRRVLSTGKLQLVRIAADRRNACYFTQPIRRVVRASLGEKKHPRPPHINYAGGTFSSAALKARPGMKGTALFIRPDYRNLQTVMAFYEDGSVFGPLQAEGYWGRWPNDVRIRKIYASHRAAGRLGSRADDQPLQALYRYLGTGAKRDKTLALQLAYVVRFLQRNFEKLELAQIELDATLMSRAANDGHEDAAPGAIEDAVVVQHDSIASAPAVLLLKNSRYSDAPEAQPDMPQMATRRHVGRGSAGITVPRLIRR